MPGLPDCGRIVERIMLALHAVHLSLGCFYRQKHKLDSSLFQRGEKPQLTYEMDRAIGNMPRSNVLFAFHLLELCLFFRLTFMDHAPKCVGVCLP